MAISTSCWTGWNASSSRSIPGAASDVQCALVDYPAQCGQPGFERQNVAGQGTLYRMKYPLPRAYVVWQSALAKDGPDALAKVKER